MSGAASPERTVEPAQLEVVGGRAVEAALAAGADEAEAWVERSWGTEVRVYEQAVESLSESGSHGLGLRVFAGQRPGYAYGTDLSEAGVRELAESAARSAMVADEDEYAGLPDAAGAAEVEGLRSADFADWTRRAEGRARGRDRAHRAGAFGGDAGRGHGVRRRRRELGDRQLARSLGFVRRHVGVGVRVGLRGRGRRPDDRDGRRRGRARRRRSTRR